MTYRKKLIEVSLPLDVISEASVREKSIRHGHPSTLHLWWSRKPLATSRAVLFASLVDDPSSHLEQFPTEQEQDAERERLFKFIRELVKWENSNNEEILRQAHEEILKSADGELPPFLDPFAGGGSIPLEAQRLGLESHASDLNPVAVLLNKALIEIPPKFANMPPINPEAQEALLQSNWQGIQGLVDDIRYYGKWMRDEAEKRIGHLYPKMALPPEQGEGEAAIIARLWTRTVTCPNPACGAQMPLTSKWWLSTKKGKEIWVEPSVDRTVSPPAINFSIVSGKGKPQDPPKVGRGAQFKCLCCNVVASEAYIKDESNSQRLNAALMAVAVEGKKGRIYLPPSSEVEHFYMDMTSIWKPEQKMPENPRWFSPPIYGMHTYGDIFTFRQLIALNTFSDLLQEVKECILLKTIDENHQKLNNGIEYANAVITYLAFILDKLADIANQLCAWEPVAECPRHLFARQAIPMVWDFAEGNPLGNSSGSWLVLLDNLIRSLQSPFINYKRLSTGNASQKNAMNIAISQQRAAPIISTDPPYYDNVSYADISDFFYVWLRHSLYEIYPSLFETMLVPKAQELVVTPHRFGGSKQEAQAFFEQGLHQAFEHMRAIHHPEYPMTVYYAFKQSEAEVDIDVNKYTNGKKVQAVASTGWETMLEGLISSGFTITGTWPIRTEMMSRSVGQGTNALASSIVLVCRPRPVDAPTASRRQFINELRNELADALKKMQHGSIAPVDLAQASIGPGMSIYSRYSQVIESDGSPLSVRTALQLINRELDSILAEQEGEYDLETRWAIAWFEEDAMNAGQYGRAEVLSKAKNVSIQAMKEAGILESDGGKVRLLRRDELAQPWRPGPHVTVWEVMQRMIHALDKDGWQGAGAILAQASQHGETVRDLAYRLYTLCERKGWSGEALYYNMLVTSWMDIDDQARSVISQPQQTALF